MNHEDYRVTIRAIIKDGGIQLLAYLIGENEMTVEHVDIATTAEVNLCWARPVVL